VVRRGSLQRPALSNRQRYRRRAVRLSHLRVLDSASVVRRRRVHRTCHRERVPSQYDRHVGSFERHALGRRDRSSHLRMGFLWDRDVFVSLGDVALPGRELWEPGATSAGPMDGAGGTGATFCWRGYACFSGRCDRTGVGNAACAPCRWRRSRAVFSASASSTCRPFFPCAFLHFMTGVGTRSVRLVARSSIGSSRRSARGFGEPLRSWSTTGRSRDSLSRSWGSGLRGSSFPSYLLPMSAIFGLGCDRCGTFSAARHPSSLHAGSAMRSPFWVFGSSCPRRSGRNIDGVSS